MKLKEGSTEFTFRGLEVACVCLVSLRMRGAPSPGNLYANGVSKGRLREGKARRLKEGARGGLSKSGAAGMYVGSW